LGVDRTYRGIDVDDPERTCSSGQLIATQRPTQEGQPIPPTAYCPAIQLRMASRAP